MNWKDIESSVIHSIAYEIDNLYVLFQDGSQWAYNAPISVFYQWLKAESKGKFFNLEVRGKFKGIEID